MCNGEINMLLLIMIDILTKYLVIFVLRESLSIFFLPSLPLFLCFNLVKIKNVDNIYIVDRCLFL